MSNIEKYFKEGLVDGVYKGSPYWSLVTSDNELCVLMKIVSKRIEVYLKEFIFTPESNKFFNPKSIRTVQDFTPKTAMVWFKSGDNLPLNKKDLPIFLDGILNYLKELSKNKEEIELLEEFLKVENLNEIDSISKILEIIKEYEKC